MSSNAESEASSSLDGGFRGRNRAPVLLSAWVPVLICVLAIATESTPYFGADHTSGPFRRFFEFFHGPFPQAEWDQIHHYVRKCGHFLGYGILSLAWFRAFWMAWRPIVTLNRRRMRAHLLAMAGTLVVASCDEIHQTFLPNRTGTFLDVIVDCSGAATLQIVLWLIMRWRLP